jgi:hypothetical protein
VSKEAPHPLNMPLEVWWAKIDPNLKKTGICDDFFVNFDSFVVHAILTQS